MRHGNDREAAKHDDGYSYDRSGPSQGWKGAEAHTLRLEPSKALRQRISEMKAEAQRTEEIG